MITVCICGAAGRMGRANVEVFSNDKEITIGGALEHSSSQYLGKDAGTVAGIDSIGVTITDSEEIIRNCDVVIDFTNPEATKKHLKFAVQYGKSIVIGTTGFDQEEIFHIKKYSESIPIVFSPNMSIGINVLFYCVRKAAELLGDDFDTEILEVHHSKKKDAPSGTALAFGKLIAEAKGLNFEEVATYSRKGMIGERRKGTIGIQSLRLSDVVGEHTILFGAPGERVEFVHRCTSRKTFAMGALRATKYVVTKKNGLFTMEDVLGIK